MKVGMKGLPIHRKLAMYKWEEKLEECVTLCMLRTLGIPLSRYGTELDDMKQYEYR